jgi:hypothetical protein
VYTTLVFRLQSSIAMRGIHVHSSGVSADTRQTIAEAVVTAVGDRQGDWEVAITDDPDNNAWDVEIQGPNRFNWSRRFSGEDRDSSAISAAVNDAITTSQRVA